MNLILKVCLFILIYAILTPHIVSSHDIWIYGQPSLYVTDPNQKIILGATVGSDFPREEIAIKKSRIHESYAVDTKGQRIELTWMEGEHASTSELPLAKGEHAYIVLVQEPSFIELTGEQFKEYLVHEGLGNVQKMRESLRIAKEPAREIYRRYIKAWVHAGREENGTSLAAKPLGLKIEIVPRTSPCLAKELSVQVLFENKPLSGQVILYGRDSSDLQESITDGEGNARISISEPGHWFVKTIHMVHAQTPERLGKNEAEWLSYWATFTFDIPE